MDCTTLKPGVKCGFMTTSGCGFNGGNCYPITQNCEGCEKVQILEAGSYCQVFGNPKSKWSIGKCNMATHVKSEAVKETKTVNALKASKRKARGK